MNPHQTNSKMNFRMRKSVLVCTLALSTEVFCFNAGAADSLRICVPQTCSSATNLAAKPVVHKKFVAPKKTIVVPKEKYDPLAVDSSILLKDVPVKEIELPGVLHVDGESAQAFDPTKSHKISWGNQGIQPIILSLTGPDLIVMPFADPYIIGNSYLNIQKRANSNNVYISFVFPEGVKPIPVSIFIEDPAGGSALGLQLIPKQISQQTYTVVDDGGRNTQKQTEKGAGYTTHVQELMEIAASGGTPSGYSAMPYNLPPIIFHDLKLDVVRRLSNTEGDLYIYEVTNPTSKAITLTEQEFDGPRVKAVSIFPKPEIQGNEKATVIVFAKKMEGK